MFDSDQPWNRLFKIKKVVTSFFSGTFPEQSWKNLSIWVFFLEWSKTWCKIKQIWSSDGKSVFVETVNKEKTKNTQSNLSTKKYSCKYEKQFSVIELYRKNPLFCMSYCFQIWIHWLRNEESPVGLQHWGSENQPRFLNQSHNLLLHFLWACNLCFTWKQGLDMY